MKQPVSGNNKQRVAVVRRRFFRRTPTLHDPWLTMNMHLFNFNSGWNQLLLREQIQQFSK
jgi:hypothetical protein